jgi:hypothetical protein|tara:strand:+ start:3944 stop:4186 length:243 start_codon:yes stop_codon:yes gene_type:complete
VVDVGTFMDGDKDLVCENCKYWMPVSGMLKRSGLVVRKMGTCLKGIHDWESGVGTLLEGELSPGIYTGPHFGCVHFEGEK